MQVRSLIRTIDLGVALGVLVLFIMLAAFSWMTRFADRQTLVLESRLVRDEMQAALSNFEDSIYVAGSNVETWLSAGANQRAIVPDEPEVPPQAATGSAVAALIADAATLQRLRALSGTLRETSLPRESRSDFVLLGSAAPYMLARVMRLPQSAGRAGLAVEIWDASDMSAKLSRFEIALQPVAPAAERSGAGNAIDIISMAGEPVAVLHWSGRRVGPLFERLVLPVLTAVLFLALWSMLLLRNRWRDTREAYQQEIGAVRTIALTDPLTGLPNRRALFDHLSQVATKLGEAQAATVLLLDLDGFKTVNDTLGHRVGDEVIGKAAACFAKFFEGRGFVGRLGGDEFVAVLPGTLGGAALAEEHAALSGRLAAALSYDAHVGRIGVSIGAVVSDGQGGSGDNLIRLADIALYQAKQRGRAMAVAYEPAMEHAATHRKTLERELRAAVGAGELRLHHQPIVEAISGEVKGYESLVRWKHPERGMVSPGEFIPIAEESDLIVEIGSYVLEHAIAELASADNRYISVNVTGRQILKPNFAREVAALIARYRLDPGRLCLEVTETSLIADGEKVASVMEEVRKLGVRFAIDDFGAGYSSLGYLLKFKFDILKIDRDFIITLDDKPEASMIVMSIVSLARSLGMRVVGEGVETPAQHRFLASAGCTLVQGYLFGRPAPAAELLPPVAPTRAAEATIIAPGTTRAA